MNLRQNRTLRDLARRLPVASAYERRIAELTGEVESLAAQLRAASGSPAPGAASGHPLWVPPGHFYSPFPSLEALAERTDVFGRDPVDVPAVDLGVDAQWALLDELEPLVAGVEWPRTPAEAEAAGTRYWADNPAYADGDALFLRAMLRHVRPKQLVELGSGYSSAQTLDTRDQFLDGELAVTFVDPYPELLESLLRPDDRASVTILPVGTEALDPGVITSLQAGDVLFIDSTHVAKPGSDVNRNLFEILPMLNPGVVVHLHDIFPAFEYPEDWVREGRGWTELYVLRAFLMYNHAYEVVLWPALLHVLDREQVERRFPPMARNAGGAIWLRKTAAG
jgi:hypothetical protein